MNKQRRVLPGLIATLALLLMATPDAFSHAGHDKAPGEEDTISGGPIQITAEAKKNLNITTETSELRSIDNTILVIGNIEPIPAMSATISSRISGRVVDVKALENDAVQKDQALVTVESRMIGDPPPRVEYAAPISGVVIDRHVVTGDAVEPDGHLLEIADLSSVYAEGRVFEGQIASIKTGQKVRVQVESYPNDSFEGVIDRTGATLDPETRTLKIWVRITNTDLKLRPNMRASLYVVTASTDDTVAVPRSAVLGEMGNFFVFVQTDAAGLVYEKRPVVTGMKDDHYTEITEGVLPGDDVVKEGNYQLQYVSSQKPAPKAAAAAATTTDKPKNP